MLTHRQLGRPAERVPPPRRAPVPDRSGRYLSCGHRRAANARNPRASARAAKGTAVTRTRRLARLEATHIHVNSRHVEATAGRLQAALVPVELHIVFVPPNRVGAAAPVVAAVEPQGISKENQARAVYSQPCRASPLVRLHKARAVGRCHGTMERSHERAEGPNQAGNSQTSVRGSRTPRIRATVVSVPRELPRQRFVWQSSRCASF